MLGPSLQVSEARARIEEAEGERLLSSDQITREAVRAAEQDGIVFIDEVGWLAGCLAGWVCGMRVVVMRCMCAPALRL